MPSQQAFPVPTQTTADSLVSLASLTDAASRPNNECWAPAQVYNGSAWVWAWEPTRPVGYKVNGTTIRPDAGTLDSFGIAGATSAATTSVGDVNGVRYWQSANTTDSSVVFNSGATVLELDTVSTVTFGFVMFSSITDIRHMVYVSTASTTTMVGAAAPASGSYIALRYDTGAGDTTFQLLCRDGTTTGSTVDTGIAPSANTRYRLVLSQNSAGTEVQAWMGTARGPLALVATLTSANNIPAAATSLLAGMANKALAGTSRGVRMSSFHTVAP